MGAVLARNEIVLQMKEALALNSDKGRVVVL